VSDIIKRLDRLRTAADFFRAHSDEKDPATRELLEEFCRDITEAHRVIKERTDLKERMAKVMEDLAVERSSNRRMRVALEVWLALIGPYPLGYIEVSAGTTVANAVKKTREALGIES
jgi:DNA-directed RNA polymerase subunit N (RpoN/RPB10)